MKVWWSLCLCALSVLGASACEEAGKGTSAPAPASRPKPAPATSGARLDGRCEHGLPHAVCTQCNPALAAVFKSKGDWCDEHGFPESFCPTCNPKGVAPDVGDTELDTIEARVVRFRSAEIERAAGIETVPAEAGVASRAIECTARIAFDADRVADIRAIVPGIVRRVRTELGAKVKRGAPLFELESTRVGEIQGALQGARERVRTAEANLARQLELKENEIASARQVEVAEQELAAARTEARTAEAALRMAGAAASAPSGRYTLSAPIDGSVVRRPAVVGLFATESESLATIADTSVMWALCDVPEADAARVELGQRVVVTVQGEKSAPAEGRLTWISAEVEPRTRTVMARAELPNEAGRLRANQFAVARIETGVARAAAVVPRAAVQRVGTREVVFVRQRPGVYQPRVVERFGDGPTVSVEGRVKAGDAVVTTGAVLLRTEVMPGSIGAGCCEVEPRGAD